MNKRIAIVGTELTISPIEELSEKFDIVCSQQNQSIISLMSKPNSLVKSFHFGKVVNKSLQHQFISEVNKDGLHDLMTSRPEAIVIDFLPDIFYGVAIGPNDFIVTNRFDEINELNELSKSNLYEFITPFAEPQLYSTLLRKAMRDFSNFIENNMPGVKVIINEITFDSTYPQSELTNSTLQMFYEEAEKIFSSFEKISTYFFSDSIQKYSVEFSDSLYSKIDNVKNEPYNIANFIRNLDFSDGDNYWENLKNEFEVSENRLSIDRRGKKGSVMFVSDPVQISARKGNARKFKLSFDVMIDDVFAMGANDLYFIVRTYDNKLFSGHGTESHGLYAKFDNLTSKKWKHIEKTFELIGDYLYLGPMLRGQTKAKYKNIEFEEIISEDDKNETTSRFQSLFKKK